MELAVHLRDLTQVKALNDLPGHLSILYGEKAFKGLEWSAPIDQRPVRLYIGDEFCIHRLPSPDQLDTLCQLAKGENKAFTFLTPPLTDEGMDRCRLLFDVFKEMDSRTEVVVNDWGVLFFF